MGLVDKTIQGTIWSYSAEIIAKVISPLSFLILTRLLSPEDYGVVAVATTLLMFIDIICDLGTSKVIIQLKSDNNKDFASYCNAAFFINVCIGFILFILTEIFAEQIASYYYQPKSEAVIRVMAIQIISYSLSSIQNSLFRKSLNFKFLFWIRLITIACPLFVAIPIAFLGGGLWALVVSSCMGSVLQCIALWTHSNWRPNIVCFKEHFMKLFGKSIWNTVNQLVVWIPISFDTYLIAKYISTSDLGLYTSARALFTAASGLILSPFLPVIFSSLSKVSESAQFERITYFSQKILFSVAVCCVVFIFLFADYLVPILFEKEWVGITIIIQIVFVIMGYEYFGSIILESLRARGLFKAVAYISLVSLIIVVPCLFFAAETGNIKVYATVRSLSLYVPLIGNLILADRINIKFSVCLQNNLYSLISSFAIIACFCLTDISHLRTALAVLVKAAVYLLFMSLFFVFNKKTAVSIIVYIKKLLLPRKK